MLEELQRLQTHLSVLRARLTETEAENQRLVSTQILSNEQFNAQLELKNGIISEKEGKIVQLSDKLKQSNSEYQLLSTDAKALADRYARLEKSCTELKNRFQEILAERNELRVLREKMLNDQRFAQQEMQALKNERERLLQKNEHAKAKVEAIIQRLSILGTSQDQHAQEIQHLAHPNDNNEET